MSEPIPEELASAHLRFAELVADIRPQLHRYCARMVGSTIDGEDVVQDALARAFYALSMMTEVPALKPWLFRIAHNRAIDHLRRHDRRSGEELDEAVMPAHVETPLEDREIAAAAMALFLELTPLQRSCVILKDVLGYSLAEVSEVLDATVPAIKAALHRGRERLRALAAGGMPEAPPPLDGPTARTLARYVELFNARDWDGLRALLADDVQLELVGRARRTGALVGEYFSNYERKDDWRFHVGSVEGRPALVASDPTTGSDDPVYFVLLQLGGDGRVRGIRDFRYARYVMRDAAVTV